MTKHCRRCGRFAGDSELCALGKGCNRSRVAVRPTHAAEAHVRGADATDLKTANRRPDERGVAKGAFYLGVLLAERGELDQAEEAFGRADQRGHAAAAWNLGVLLEERGNVAGAEAAYRRADERGVAEGAFYLGVLLAERGELDQAEEAFGRADQRGHAAAAWNLGVLLEERGNVAGAEAAYRRADERGVAEGAFYRGVLLAERGELDQAEEAFGRADQRGHAAAAWNLGVLLEERGNVAGAEAAYRRADERGDADGTFNLGAPLEEKQRLPEAEKADWPAARGESTSASDLSVPEKRPEISGVLAARIGAVCRERHIRAACRERHFTELAPAPRIDLGDPIQTPADNLDRRAHRGVAALSRRFLCLLGAGLVILAGLVTLADAKAGTRVAATTSGSSPPTRKVHPARAGSLGESPRATPTTLGK